MQAQGIQTPFNGGDNWTKTKTTPNGAISHLLLDLAGEESHRWHPLAEDFIALGRKLAELGFTYCRGQVMIVE